MATGTWKQAKTVFGPESAGTLMTPQEFDRADFEDGWRYELIHGVLIVSPIPSEGEADPNGELDYWLRSYRDNHPLGSALDATLQERIVRCGRNRRRADRLIWAGLGRLPRKNEKPTIVGEFVSKGKRNRKRDYETKRKEYRKAGIKEYWIIDRFERIMIVYSRHGKRIIREGETYTTPLLPGFELPLARLFAVADRWARRMAE